MDRRKDFWQTVYLAVVFRNHGRRLAGHFWDVEGTDGFTLTAIKPWENHPDGWLVFAKSSIYKIATEGKMPS
jgi:hypothetical protein